MIGTRLKHFFIAVGVFCLLGFFVFLVSQISILTHREAYTVSTRPSASIALVFGAGVLPNGEPSHALYDRVITGVELYKEGKVGKLLMTGDNGTRHYNEVAVMKKVALEEGVVESDIILDYAGFNTYDSCYRAGAIFGVTTTIAVSQEFHLARIDYICEARGITTYPVIADKRAYREAKVYWPMREMLARSKAWLNVFFIRPEPKFLGDPEHEWQTM
jgi:vancomycin permeability regulator SanA